MRPPPSLQQAAYPTAAAGCSQFRAPRARSARILRPGFAIKDLTVGLAIASVITIAGLCLVLVSTVPDEEEHGRDWADIRTLETNLVRYRNMAGQIPSQAQGLGAIVHKPDGEPQPKEWHQLADASTIIDPWGHPYQYRNPGKRNPGGVDVFSLGPDGVEGTSDDSYGE